jgi:hypothetical protein
MKRLIVRIACAMVMGGFLWGGLPASPALATLVTYNFTGAVGEVSTPLFSALNAGQTLTGSFTFDNAIADSKTGSASTGRYNDAITSFNVNLGVWSASLGSEGSHNNNVIKIGNGSSDTFEVRAPLSGDGVGSYEPLYFRLTLKDPSGTVFGDDSLPSTGPSLSSFASDRFRIVFTSETGIAKVRGNLTSLTAVPLPASVIMFGAGLIALVGLGTGSWRRSHNSLA